MILVHKNEDRDSLLVELWMGLSSHCLLKRVLRIRNRDQGLRYMEEQGWEREMDQCWMSGRLEGIVAWDWLSEKNEQKVSALGGNGAGQWRRKFIMKRRRDCSPAAFWISGAGVGELGLVLYGSSVQFMVSLCGWLILRVYWGAVWGL